MGNCFKWLLIFCCPVFLTAQSTFQTIIEKNDTTSPSFPIGSITEAINGDIYAVGTIYPGGWYSKNRLIKLNKYGEVIWDTTYSYTSSHEKFPELIPASDGGVILTSTSWSYPLDDNDTLTDILVRKVNSQGTVEWQKVLSARNFHNMYFTKDGNYLLTGSIHEAKYYQGLDMIAYKIDQEGNILWSIQLGKQADDFPYDRERSRSIKQIDDQIYVCGSHSNDSSLNLNGLLYALDTEGNLLWDIFLPYTEEETKARIRFVFKFLGRHFFKSTLGIFEFDPKTGEYWKVTSSLEIRDTGAQNSGYNFATFCSIDQMNVINGNSGGPFYLKKYNNLSEPYFENEISGVADYFVEYIPASDGGLLLLTGQDESMYITKTDCKGNIDHWSEDCNSKIPAESQMTIYPNPSSDKITIEATFDFDEIQVFDTYRQRTIYKNPCSCPRMELDVSKLAAGVYGVIISGDENVASSKLVKI